MPQVPKIKTKDFVVHSIPIQQKIMIHKHINSTTNIQIPHNTMDGSSQMTSLNKKSKMS